MKSIESKTNYVYASIQAQGCITKIYTEFKKVKINMILNDLSPVVDSQNLNLNLGSGFVVILHSISTLTDDA